MPHIERLRESLMAHRRATAGRAPQRVPAPEEPQRISSRTWAIGVVLLAGTVLLALVARSAIVPTIAVVAVILALGIVGGVFLYLLDWLAGGWPSWRNVAYATAVPFMVAGFALLGGLGLLIAFVVLFVLAIGPGCIVAVVRRRG